MSGSGPVAVDTWRNVKMVGVVFAVLLFVVSGVWLAGVTGAGPVQGSVDPLVSLSSDCSTTSTTSSGGACSPDPTSNEGQAVNSVSGPLAAVSPVGLGLLVGLIGLYPLWWAVRAVSRWLRG